MREAHKEHCIMKLESKKLSCSERLKFLKEGRKTCNKSKHAEYTPNWQRGDLKWLTKHGHLEGATKRNSMHVLIEHTNQQRMIHTLQSK